MSKGWTTLDKLRKGAVFETKDGILAVKGEWTYDTLSQYACIRLDNGAYAYFSDRNETLVREIVVPEHGLTVAWYVEVLCSGGWKVIGAFADEASAWEFGQKHIEARVYDGKECVGVKDGFQRPWRAPTEEDFG